MFQKTMWCFLNTQSLEIRSRELVENSTLIQKTKIEIGYQCLEYVFSVICSFFNILIDFMTGLPRSVLTKSLAFVDWSTEFDKLVSCFPTIN